MKKDFFTYDNVRAAVEKAGFKFFLGNFNLNMIGVRTSNRKANNFDDFFILCYNDGDKQIIWVNDEFTTDPGIYYLQQKLLNPKGCAILPRGQHKGLWQIGMHGYKNPYKAFTQKSPVAVYRDRDKDNIIEFDTASLDRPEVIGINQHHGFGSTNVGPNSAGCQVHADEAQLNHVLSIAEQSLKYYGNSFTYTLLHEEDFIAG